MEMISTIRRAGEWVSDRLNGAYFDVYARATTAERGQGLVEYGLVLAVVALVALIAMKAVGTDLTKAFNEISDGLKTR